MSRVAKSKLLSWALRHRPDELGIVLDEAGWTDVSRLLDALAARGTAIERAELLEIVRTSDKARFALSADGTRIRAQQGHSVPVDLGYEPADPPEKLYHGTVARSLASIRTTGLVRGKRHHVHLSETIEMARSVGGRRGRPVVLLVRSRALALSGATFFRTPNGVWLVGTVPPDFIGFPE